jgi:hypothetical protein
MESIMVNFKVINGGTLISTRDKKQDWVYIGVKGIIGLMEDNPENHVVVLKRLVDLFGIHVATAKEIFDFVRLAKTLQL